MKEEDRKLLLKDLSGRLPYGVYVEHIRNGMRGHLHNLKVYPLYDKTDDHIYDYICYIDFLGDGDYFDIDVFKPLLFPLSSMTEEQFEEFLDICGWCGYIDEVRQGDFFNREENLGFTHIYGTMDWLNKNHFDFRGLIEKGLAIDATNLNIY